MSPKHSTLNARHSILLTGGGTGGHLAIVKAVKDALLKRGVRPLYVGSERGQDREWFETDEGFDAKLFLPTRGVVDQRGLARLASLRMVYRGMRSARDFMRKRDVKAVLSVGGFSAAPASFAALAMGVPLFIHEQNAVSGRLNRLLKPWARVFFSSYEGERVDYPVRERFFETARTRERVETVIFLGGSQGARAINDLALEAAPALRKLGVRIVHQTGRSDYGRVAEAYERMGVAAECFGFHPELHEKIASADLAVSRAGAGTLWELAANRLPALFIPYPYAAGDHQYHNALRLVREGAGWLARQEEVRVEDLLAVVKNPEALRRASERLKETIAPGGAEKIADALIAAVSYS